MENVRMSMKQVIKGKFGEEEKNSKTARSTKRAVKKVSKNKKGKYEIRMINGEKHMILRTVI